MALLRDLLRLHDPSFDGLRIAELANLQCAVSTSGSYVWAHPQEIKEMGEKLVPCDPEYHEALPSSESTAASAPPTSLQLTLTVKHLKGLSSWDSYKVLCAWQLVHPTSAAPLAFGTTEPISSDSATITWPPTPNRVMGVASIAMLRECRLLVQVKRASRLLGKLKCVITVRL
jgi:hypothetical protein